MIAAGCQKGRVLRLVLMVLPLVAAGIRGIPPAAAQDSEAAPTDRFANEPRRPKAGSPIRFSGTWDEARAEARRTGRRLLAYFTGENCGWCRVLEKRTFTDAEVVALSEQFVRVEIHIGEEENLRLADEFRIDSIPRSCVFTPDGRVIDWRVGYVPAAEYAAWLKGVGTTPPAHALAGRKEVAPAPVGAPEAEADVVIWSVDSDRGIERWNDGIWTGHAQLLGLLRAAGLRPRVEHMTREDFASRWESAAAQGRTPDLMTANQIAGQIRGLETKGRLLHVRSERLAWMPEVASCTDFAGRWVFLVAGSPHEFAGRMAVEELLKPGPETGLPGPELPPAAGADEAVSVARDAVIAFISGDAEGLRRSASASSPQLSRCTNPPEYRRNWDVEAGPVEVRGNGAIAFAKVAMRFRGKSMIGADPVLVVLRREGSHWKAFSVGDDVWCLRALPDLCRLALHPRGDTPAAPPTPRLLQPEGDAKIPTTDHSFAWEIPAGGAPLAAQVGEVLLDEKGSRWPSIRIKVYPGEPRSRSVPVAEPALTGMTSAEMRWCVWAIGADGGLSVSEVRRYRAR